MPNECLTLLRAGSSPAATLLGGCRDSTGALVGFQTRAASDAIMIEKLSELVIPKKEGQDVKAGLSCRWPSDDDSSWRRAPEIGDRIGNDLTAQVGQSRVWIGSTLVGDNRAHHPVPHVPGRIAEASLQSDRPGDGGFD